jgi:sulfur carrier protein ThiS
VRVEVRLFATLSVFLPPQSREGAVTLDLPSGSTVHDAMRRLGIPAEMERVALVNGADATPESSLRPGDVLTVFPPLAGGLDVDGGADMALDFRPSSRPGGAVALA